MRKPAFRFGDRVRVRPGERCDVTGDVTYGGWDGRVERIEGHEDNFHYEVWWSDETQDAVHRVHEEIWWREQVDDYGLWFREDQLEPHVGDAPRDSLSEEFVREFDARDERIAAALGVGDGEIPFPNQQTLASYHRHLAERLRFPFEAQVETIAPGEPEPAEPEGADDDDEFAVEGAQADVDDEFVTCDVTVLELVPPDDQDADDVEFDGILCRTLEQNRPWEVPLATVRVKGDGANRQLVEDYCYWFDTWSRIDANYNVPYDAPDEEEFDAQGGPDADWGEEDDLGEAGDVEDFLDAGARTASEARRLDPPAPITRENPRVGRNDPCPCGSGKKFKKCCLNKAASPPGTSPPT